ncbi:MAG: GAF domain-containing protein, partial [Anaerolineales bacterium]|nr:GAF domain-containing protein [Anaerolineales bacterium]
GGNSMIGQCVATSQAQVSQQAVEEEQRFTNPLLPETRSEMALPLISRGQVIGAMTIQSTRPAAFSEEDIAVLQTMADQIANALQNANLFNQTQARAGELAILNEMSRVLTANLDVNVILRNIYLYASRLVDTSTFFIALHEPETNLLHFPLATEGNQELKIPSRPFGSGLTEHVIQNGQPLLIRDNVETQAMELGINVQVTGWMAKCWLGVPVMIGERSMGIICVQSETPQHFNERHRDLLEAIATQSAIALQNARLFGQTQEALADTETLLNVTRVASSSLDFQQTLFEVLDLVLASTDFDSGLISIINPDTDHLELIAHRLPEPFLNSLIKNGLENTLCDLVYRQEQSITLTDLTVDPPVDVSGLLALGFKSYQGVTLEARGTILGTLCAFKRDTLVTGDKSLSLMQAVGQQIGVALQNANLFEQTLRQTEDLDVLNEMGRVLSSLFDMNAVAETVHEYTTRLMDTTNFYLALYDQENEWLSFPLSIIDKQPYQNPGRPMASGMTEYVIRTGSPLLLRDNTLERMTELGIEFMAMGDDTPAQSWLGAPLTIGRSVIGVIAIQSITTPRLYTDRHRELLSSIASQAAIAIQNANLFAQTQQQLADLTAIQQTTAELSAALTFDEVVNSLLGNLANSVQADQVTLFMLRGQALVRTAVHPQPSDPGVLGQSIQLDQYPLTKRVIETRQPMAVAANDPLLQPHARQAFQQAGISANATIPLVGPEGVLGTLSIARFDPSPIFNAQEVNLLNTLASQAAISLQNARLFEETQSRSEELALINRVVSAVAATLDLDESLQIVAREVGSALNLQTGIAMFNEDRTALTLVGEYRVEGSGGSILGANIPLEGNLATQKVLKTRQTVIIESPQEDPLTAPIHDLLAARNVHGLMITPIIVSAEVIGILGVDIIDPERSLTAEEMRLIQTIVLQASTAISNSRLFEQVQLQLTNLTTLSNVSQALASAPLDLFEVATVIAAQFSNAFETASVRVALLSGLERQLEVIGHVQTDASGAQVMGKNIGDLWSLNEQPVFAELLAKLEPRAILSTELGLDEPGQATLALIPLAVKGQASGLIELRGQDTSARYGKEQLNLAMTLANQAAVALENARLYMEQRATAEQLRELDKLKSQFLANMSHELRTPLNSIIGFSRVIMKGIDGPVSDLQQQDLSAIYNAGQHLLNMINDILDISKIEAGKMELAFEETQLPEIVNSVMSTARGLVKDKPVQLITAVEEDLPVIKADPTRVRQILLNLISNAAKFTDEGSITVSAQRRVTPNGRPEILVTVADTGVGIAP